MSLSRPRVDNWGAVDVRSIDEMSRDDLRRWVRDRLRGLDATCPDDARSGDMPQYLLKVLYPKLDRATREDLQGIVLEFLADLFRVPNSEWLGEPGSRLLSLLDPILVQSPRRDEAVGLLLGMADTPRFTEGPFPNLHFRALQALLGLRHRADRRFWERQFQLGGERYAPVVLEGLARVDASVLLDWLADVPWSEAVGDAFEGLLPSLLEDYGAGKMTALVERVLPRLTPEAASAVTRMCVDEALTLGPDRPVQPGPTPLTLRNKRGLAPPVPKAKWFNGFFPQTRLRYGLILALLIVIVCIGTMTLTGNSLSSAVGAVLNMFGD